MFWLAVTGSGESVLLTERSALSAVTVVVAVETLFPVARSVTAEETVATFVIGLAAPTFTFTTRVKTCGPAATVRLGLVASTRPTPPTDGVVTLHPPGAVNET